MFLTMGIPRPVDWADGDAWELGKQIRLELFGGEFNDPPKLGFPYPDLYTHLRQWTPVREDYTAMGSLLCRAAALAILIDKATKTPALK